MVYDTQANAKGTEFTQAAGELIKKVEDGQESLINPRRKEIATALQTLLSSECGYAALALREQDPADAIPASLQLPALANEYAPSTQSLVYSFEERSKWNENDGFFKTSAVHVPSVPDKCAKLEMDLGVGITAAQLGYAESTFSQLTSDELLGNGYSAFFQNLIASRLQNEVSKKTGSNTEPSVSNSFSFIVTDTFPSLPGMDGGLESLSIQVAESIIVNVTIGSKRQAESAARMRNARVIPIGGHSSVQTISQDPTSGLPNNIRTMLS